MLIELSEIEAIVAGQRYGEDKTVSSVSIDTRTLKPGDLFIAVKGANFDGSDFAEKAAEAGAAAALLPRRVETDLPQIIVEDTRRAMADLAKAVRLKSGATVIGITGSNGKTTVKEMTAAILGEREKAIATEGNLNNDIGVPLTLLRMDSSERYAVVEMGANHPGEIAYLSRYALPDVALITNVGPAHIEGFGSVDGVAKAKGEMIVSLGKDGAAVLNADDPYFEMWKSYAGGKKIVTFGLNGPADVAATNIRGGIRMNRFATEYELNYAGESYPMEMALAGKHNVANALAASAACLSVGIEPEQIRQGLQRMNPVSGRLQPLPGYKGGIVINDSYNANPASLKAALEVLKTMDGEPWVALGAFGELGRDSEKIHEEMGRMIKRIGVVRLLAIGPDAENAVKGFGRGAVFFDSHEKMISELRNEMKGREALLIKGSRKQQMEKVVNALTDKSGA